MDNFNDFVDLEAEIYDWQDDILIPADEIDEEAFRQFVNSKFDFWFIMSKELLISMLRKGQTGDEILTILDMISDGDDANSAEPTLDEIQFWNCPRGLDNWAPIL